MWALDDQSGGGKKRPSTKRRNHATDTSLSLPALSAPWLTKPQQPQRWTDREDVRTNAQYTGGALLGAWLLRRVVAAVFFGGAGGGGGARRRTNNKRRRQPQPHQPGPLTTLIGALAGVACVYRAKGGDLNAKAQQLTQAAQRRLREAECAVREQADLAERRVRAAMREAEVEVIPALQAEAEQGRRQLEWSMRQVERAMQEAADAVEVEVIEARRRRGGG